MRSVLLMAVTALLVLPATALGATRYASPGGVGFGTCTEAAPCSLAYAVTAAASGDEVVVAPGTYPVATRIEATVPLSIHGAFGQPRPRLVGVREVTPLESFYPLRLSNLAIESTESGRGSLYANTEEEEGDVFDHVELIATGTRVLALRPAVNWTMTDSLVVAKGELATGVFVQGTVTDTATMRNDTVITEGKESTAIEILVSAAGVSPAIQATDVIAAGEVAAIAEEGWGRKSSIVFDHSDVQGEITGNGTVSSISAQTAAPQFVDPAAGDYREAVSSPTIDAGVSEAANGATDLDGNPRALPGSLNCSAQQPAPVTDIGAYEFVPVVPPCVPIVAKAPGTALGKAMFKGLRAKFRFQAVEAPATGFECKLDRKPWHRCSSPRTYKRLRPGRHVFRVRAVGAAGTDASPALRKFRIYRPPVHRHGVG